MAERRMFTKKITDDDNFLSLSASAQALYLHLSMSADDDGFCNQVSIAMFRAHSSVADLQQLLEKRYIYQFENGVIVIKHWRMANALRKDRYTPTVFQEELGQLGIKDNGSYTWLPDGCQVVADCLPQDRIDKDRIDKDRIDKDRIDKDRIGKDRLDKDSIDKDNINNTSYYSSDKSDDVITFSTPKDNTKYEIEDVIKYWNDCCLSTNIKAVKKISAGTERYKMLGKRIKDYGVNEIKIAIDNIFESNFLQGKVNEFIITFDWFIKPNNFVKVYEGNYTNSAVKPKGTGTIDWDSL